MKNVFVVTADGYTADGTSIMDYGSKVYLVGVFDNFEDARIAAINCGGAMPEITIIEQNRAYPLKWRDEDNRSFGKENSYFLGGGCAE